MFLSKFNKIQKLFVGAASLVAGMFLLTASVGAIPYTGASTPPSPVPAFNVYTGVDQGVGNESDFFRARVDDGSQTDYSDPLNASCAVGQKIQLRVYVHNGASADLNNGGNGPSVAHDTKVAVNLKNSNAATKFAPVATISASNAATVADAANINCAGQPVKLSYVKNSASQYSIGTGVVQLNDDQLLGAGAPIRSHAVAGDVWGCWNERVYVVLTVQVEQVPPVVSSGECKVTDLTTYDNRKVQVKVNGSTTANASIVGYKIDWGDNTTPSSNQTDSHTYAKDGTYTIVSSVLVKFVGADGQTHTEWKTAEACKKQVPFKNNVPTTPPTVVTTTSLPDTGAGNVAAIFTAFTAAGAVAYRTFMARRLSRQ